jgi:pyruvate formate lyase activating enzyme
MTGEDRRPLIFDIRRFALDDGPGIRTTVFFKGCPLSCTWCQNPESQKTGPEIACYPNLCIGCGDCSRVCPENAIDLKNPSIIRREACTACGRCAEACPATALRQVGRYYPIDALSDLLMADRNFYLTSGGGVTFSGGEPTLHPAYLGEASQVLKNNRVHVTLQTAGTFDLHAFETKVLPWVDLIHFDIKLIDSNEHRRFIGADNARILRNFAALYRKAPGKILPRVPLIPGITATGHNIRHIAMFLKRQGCRRCQFLPYNPGGATKRTAIGEAMPPGLPEAALSAAQEEALKREFRKVLTDA